MIEGDVSKVLSPLSVNLIREARMIRVQFSSIAQNPVCELVNVSDLLREPGHGFLVLLLASVILDDNATSVLLKQSDQPLDFSLGLILSTLDQDFVTAIVALGRTGFDVGQVDLMGLKD